MAGIASFVVMCGSGVEFGEECESGPVGADGAVFAPMCRVGMTKWTGVRHAGLVGVK